jgi:hypothetical protein
MRKRTTLFVVLLVLVVLTPILTMVWFGALIDRQRARDASAAFAPVEALGGAVRLHAVPFEKYGHYVVEFPRNAKLSDENISQLVSLNTLPAKNTLDIVIQTTNVTDRAIPRLKAIETIDGLDVTQSSISDRGIEELRQALPETIVKQRGTADAAK